MPSTPPGSFTGEAVAARVRAVRRAVAVAAQAAGRAPEEIRIVAATKTVPAPRVAAALAAGLADVGENYVQEARAKRRALGDGGTWHLIGGLQHNKVRAAVAVFDWVQTVDSVPLATALAAAARAGGRRLPVLVQVNTSGEPAKRGVSPEGAGALAEAILRLDALALEGFMTIGPLGAPGEGARPAFRLLRELRDGAATRLGVELPHLSMGMSDDFRVAVEEGASMLRLGRALFGPRDIQ